MKKRNYWPLLFIAIFSFTFGMIVWTVMSAVKTPVFEDKSFLNSYQNVNDQFNNMMESNEAFKKVYTFEMTINDRKFELLVDDLFKSQRVIEKKSLHKDTFYKGKNSVAFKVEDKNGNDIRDLKIDLKVTKAINDESDIDISNKENAQTSFDFVIPIEGNWNITGVVETNDNQKAYFFIKSNAIRK